MDHSYWLPEIAIALVLSFVVHDFELKHAHPFAPVAHNHEQQREQDDNTSVSAYTHGDRKDFLALLLLIATIPGVLFGARSAFRVIVAYIPIAPRRSTYDYHRLLFRRGILHSKRY